MADAAHHHSTRRWYLRPPVWVLGLVVLGLAAFGIVEFGSRPSPAALSYSEFLAQLDAGNVADVTFQGTRVDGRLKHPVAAPAANGAAPRDAFRTQVPGISDPMLLPELRKQHVVIDVVSSSNWVSWFGRLPWPLVLVLAFVLIAGVVRLVRGGKSTDSSAVTMQQMPIMRLTSAVSGKDPVETRPQHDGGKAKSA